MQEELEPAAAQSVARMSTALEPRARDQASERPGTRLMMDTEPLKVGDVCLIDRAVRWSGV
jgi:hypothetical protein